MNDAPTPRLLIIDDDAFVREVTEMSFTSAGGWDVHVADSGAAGIELAAHLQPNVVLLDFLMPDMDGPATLAALRSGAATCDLPVIFITADEHSARAAAAVGGAQVIGVIAKPFDPMTLPDQVAACIDERAAGSSAEAVPNALADALAQLWDARRCETLQQVAELEAACSQPGAATEEARTLAHNLVGVLGSLGLYESSAIARTVDRVLLGADGGVLDVDERVAAIDAVGQLRERLATERPSL